MYIINTSFIIEPPVHTQWYEFFTTKFIPYLRENGYTNLLFTRVLTDDNNPHYTYSLQIGDSTIVDYQRFAKDAMAEYSTVVAPWFAEKAIHYTSLLKVIEL